MKIPPTLNFSPAGAKGQGAACGATDGAWGNRSHRFASSNLTLGIILLTGGDEQLPVNRHSNLEIGFRADDPS